jgi:hypothetical protein
MTTLYLHDNHCCRSGDNREIVYNKKHQTKRRNVEAKKLLVANLAADPLCEANRTMQSDGKMRLVARLTYSAWHRIILETTRYNPGPG